MIIWEKIRTTSGAPAKCKDCSKKTEEPYSAQVEVRVGSRTLVGREYLYDECMEKRR